MTRLNRRILSIPKSGFRLGNNDNPFSQSLTGDLTTNGNFNNWLSDNPVGWVVTPTETSGIQVTQRASNQTNASTPAGLGAANLFSSATNTAPILTQTGILTANSIFEVQFRISAYNSGTLFSREGDEITSVLSYTAVGTYLQYLRNVNSANYRMRGSTAPTDATIDYISIRKFNLNRQITILEDDNASFTFNPNPNPYSGEEIHLLYRIVGATDELYNCWDAYLRRNAANTAWDYRLDRISNGIRTNVTNVNTVTNVTGLRFTTSGTSHIVDTLSGSTWTNRSNITNATHQTATGLNVLYSSFTNPIALVY